MANRWQVEAFNCGEVDTADQHVVNSKKKALSIAKKWKKKYDYIEVYDVKQSEMIRVYGKKCR